MTVLLVEDDDSIADPLAAGLRRQGFDVDRVATGAEALARVNDDLELVLLDLGLPDLDGTAVCRDIRQRSAVPIIVVTARADEIDRVTLLDMGADDYVVKPFGFRELVARIRAVTRRSRQPETPTPAQRQEIGALTIDHRTHTVQVDGETVRLTPKEHDLLAFLATDPGAVRTRDEILRTVWDENWWGSTKTLDVHMASLRQKLDRDLIETIRGVGFRLRDPDDVP